MQKNTLLSKKLLFPLFTWIGIATFVWLRLVKDASDGLRVGEAYMWADWALHYIVSGVAAFRPIECWFTNHPVFLGEHFDYPFVVDFISGLIQRLGFSFGSAFLWPSLGLSILFLSSIYFFIYFRSRSVTVPFLALSILLLNGGFAFIEILRDWHDSTNGHFWQDFPQHVYSNWAERGYPYGNMTLTEFLPQRAFLLGLPIALYIISKLLKVTEFTKQIHKLHLVMLGLLAGSLLFIHPHSFLVIVLFSGFWCALNTKEYVSWICYALGAAVPSLIWWLFLHHHGTGGGGFFEWYPGWMAYEPTTKKMGFIKLWWLNWGLLLPLSVTGTIQLRLQKEPVVLFGFLLFALCNLIKFQPWSWDNTKLFTYSYLFLAIPAAQFLEHLYNRPEKFAKVQSSLCFVLLILSGLLDIYGVLRRADPGYQMYSKEEIEMASEVREKTPGCAVVLASSDHHNWLAALTGRQILMGYPGWVASYGLDYGKRLDEMRKIYSGSENALPLIEQLGIQYVLIGTKEQFEFKPNELFFTQNPNFERIMNRGNTQLYRVIRK